VPGFAVIVLAAGESSRLGQPKQLIQFEGEPLVRRAARTALESSASQVVIVVGAFAGEVSDACAGLDVTLATNLNWQLGLGRSIRAGVEALQPGLGAVVLALCDMPMVTAELLRELAEAVIDGTPAIAAAEYNCHLGVPCAFHVSQFPSLLTLSGDKGARDLVRNAKVVSRITFEACAIDIDTPEDLDRLPR
jgi:molybdenum cofactor cytidylyltransferase